MSDPDKMSGHPRVTVLMSTWNGQEYLREALDSIIAQTISDWQMIVVDDCSTDGTVEIVTAYADRDPRIHLVRLERHLGQTAALNAGLQLTQTPWVARLDQDDVAVPQRLDLQLRFAEKRPDAVLIGTWIEQIDDCGRRLGRVQPPTDSASLRREFYRRPNPFAHSSVIFRAEVARRVGGYPAELIYSQDYGLWAKLMEQGSVANLPQPLTRIRIHPDQTSSNPATLIRLTNEALAVSAAVNQTSMSGADRKAWQAGRMRAITQRAIAHWKLGDSAAMRQDTWTVLQALPANHLIALDLLALVWSTVVWGSRMRFRRIRLGLNLH